MSLLTALLFLLAGLLLVIKGADFLVEGASALAKKLAVPEIMIGLTIVAFGTSAPELIVNIFSSLQGKNEVVMGNIVGSNIFNILLILGISGLIYPLAVQKNTVWKEIPFAFLGALLLLFFAINGTFLGASTYRLALWEGIILLVLFVFFILYAFGIQSVEGDPEGFAVKTHSMKKSIIYILLGFIGLFLGGKWVVDYAVIIATKLGVSNKLIALTIVSAGTSFPELATSAVAAYKKRSDLAIGNIVGSNIFNIFFILGISAVIQPVVVSTAFWVDLAVLIFASFLLFLAMFTGKKHKLDRFEAAGFLFIYLGYIVYIILRK